MDTEDREYDSLEDLWKFELHSSTSSAQSKNNKKKKKGVVSSEEGVGDSGEGVPAAGQRWYSAAYTYWESEANCPLSGTKLAGSTLKL